MGLIPEEEEYSARKYPSQRYSRKPLVQIWVVREKMGVRVCVADAGRPACFGR